MNRHLTLDEFLKYNQERQKDWPSENWTLAEWICALTGEVGEAANIVKKIFRGDKTLDQARMDLANEFADILTYLIITADKAGIDLTEAAIFKFNEVSDRIGSEVIIPERDNDTNVAISKEHVHLLAEIDLTLDYFYAEFPEDQHPQVWNDPISHFSGGISPNDLRKIRTLLQQAAGVSDG